MAYHITNGAGRGPGVARGKRGTNGAVLAIGTCRVGKLEAPTKMTPKKGTKK